MKAGRPPPTGFDSEFAARVLADATIYSSDRKAAERHKVSVKTVMRYRARSRTDKALSSNVLEKVLESERRWDRVRNRGLTVLVERMIELSETEQDLDKVTRAVEKLGELDIAGGVLSVSRSDHQSGPTAGADAVGGIGEEADPIH